MSRMWWSACLVAVSVLIACGSARAARPNIIVILSDDMGYSDIGCYGGEIRTPNLDRLAGNGLRFTQFYNTARCCPTRACVLTGLYPHQAAVGHMMEDRSIDGYRGDLSDRAVTIAEALRPAGYATFAVGKWHVTRHAGPQGPKHNWPLQRGFDRYYGTITGAGSFFDPGSLTRDNTMISPFADPQYKPQRFYYTDAISDHAIRFITEHRAGSPDKPFFMYVAFTTAHWPMHALEEDIAKYKGMYDNGYEPIRAQRLQRMRQMGLLAPTWELSPQFGDWSKVANKAWESRCMEVYAAMIDRMDQGIGRIVQTLEKTGQIDNTLILFMQDNGACQEGVGRGGNMTRPDKPTLPPIAADVVRPEGHPKQNRAGIPTLGGTNVMPGPEDTFIAYGEAWANVSNTPFREYKHYVHEGGISTPLIAHWPAGIARKGDFERQPGHLVDIMATCIAASGATYPAERAGKPVQPMEGRSLLPAFAGKPIDREYLFWEHEGNRALRIGKWKLVAKNPDGAWQLYDMEQDRSEMHDLASANPQRVAEMAAQWEACAKRTKATPWPWKPQYGQQPGSEQKKFDLKPGADLPQEEAPRIAGKPFTITATLAATGEGVIVAHGGTAHGYALYVREGKLEFTLRRRNASQTLTAPERLPEGPVKVSVEVKKDSASLRVAGKEVASGKTGLVAQMPVDGLQVGQDLAGNVGRYETPGKFTGKIEAVVIEVGE